MSDLIGWVREPTVRSGSNLASRRSETGVEELMLPPSAASGALLVTYVALLRRCLSVAAVALKGRTIEKNSSPLAFTAVFWDPPMPAGSFGQAAMPNFRIRRGHGRPDLKKFDIGWSPAPDQPRAASIFRTAGRPDYPPTFSPFRAFAENDQGKRSGPELYIKDLPS